MKLDKEILQRKLIEKRSLSEAPEDQSLITQLNKILADAFVFYFKSHSFHWNVEGSNFNDYHAFLGQIYNQVWLATDKLAEEIRMLGAYAPNSMQQLIGTSTLTELQSKPDSAMEMFRILSDDNQKIITGLKAGQKSAEAVGETGLSNYLQDLIDAHKKLAWMLSSLQKG